MPLTAQRVEVEIRDFMERQRAYGYIRDFHFRYDINIDGIGLSCRLYSGRELQFRLTSTEIVNGDLEGLRFWLGTVGLEIRVRCEQESRQGLQNSTFVESSLFCEQYPQQALASLAMLAQQQAMLQQAQANLNAQSLQYQVAFNQGLFADCFQPDRKANEKAEELFMLVCGKEAFDTLKSGKPLPITGSKGTKYTLHKRSSYCVERVSDNARLCAVVPNVPLWDHLLGIKLMIEHDEQKFLETANVAHAGPPIPLHYQQALAENVRANNSLLQRLLGGRLGRMLGVTGDVFT